MFSLARSALTVVIVFSKNSLTHLFQMHFQLLKPLFTYAGQLVMCYHHPQVNDYHHIHYPMQIHYVKPAVLQYRHLIPAPVNRTSDSAWSQRHP